MRLAPANLCRSRFRWTDTSLPHASQTCCLHRAAQCSQAKSRDLGSEARTEAGVRLWLHPFAPMTHGKNVEKATGLRINGGNRDLEPELILFQSILPRYATFTRFAECIGSDRLGSWIRSHEEEKRQTMHDYPCQVMLNLAPETIYPSLLLVQLPPKSKTVPSVYEFPPKSEFYAMM